MCHGQNGGPCAVGTLQRARQFQEVRSVIFFVDAEVQHNIIASMLGFPAEAGADDPEQRIEPEHGSSDLREHLNRPIEALDVRQFVREDDANPLVIPVFGVVGQKNARTKEAPSTE